MGTEEMGRMKRMRLWGIDVSTASILPARQGLQAVITKIFAWGGTGGRIISLAKIPFIFSAC